MTDISDEEIKAMLTKSNTSHLSIPMLTGLFVRNITEEYFKGNIRRIVSYRTTSKINSELEKREYGEVFEDLDQVHNFLREAKITSLNIDYFCFNPDVNVYSVFQDEYGCWDDITVKPDFSDGNEFFPIRVLNPLDKDNEQPEIPFIKKYVTKNVFCQTIASLDKGLTSNCCDCENECKDKLNCRCFQLTLANYNPEDRAKLGDENIGYNNKMLMEDQITMSGIFECNINCRCNQNCWNRVVQNGTKWRFQMTKGRKGWSVRTLTDIPKGSFICTYTGKICRDFGDMAISPQWRKSDKWKYLLNLNVTQNVPKLIPSTNNKVPRINKKVRRKSAYFRNFNLKRCQNKKTCPLPKNISRVRTNRVQKPLRPLESCTIMNAKTKYFCKVSASVYNQAVKKQRLPTDLPIKTDEKYVLDGKHFGNIGKFFNHSCNPNMNAQYVFVDTHDLRFPTICFFADRNIKAGDELTWYYCYSTQSRTFLECLCDSDNCSRKFC